MNNGNNNHDPGGCVSEVTVADLLYRASDMQETDPKAAARLRDGAFELEAILAQSATPPMLAPAVSEQAVRGKAPATSGAFRRKVGV